MQPIELYTQPECPPCDITKQFLQHYDIPYIEYNIKTDLDAYKRLTNTYHALSTPTVVINGEAIIGFQIERLQQLLHINKKL